MTVKAEQANEHDDKQEDVRKKRDDHCHFEVLDLEWMAVVAKKRPFITDLSEGSARKTSNKCILFTREIPDTRSNRKGVPDCPKMGTYL